MNDLESRLSDLLHAGAPEPERVISASEIAALAQHDPPRGGFFHGWGVPLLAAAAVIVAVAAPAAVIGHINDSAGPATPGGPTPAPIVATSPPPTSSPTTPPSSTTPTTPLAVVTCLTSQLALTAGPTSGAAGSLYTTFYLTSSAGTPCSMRGFPGVSLLDAAGNIVGRPATRDGSLGPAVRLGSGERAQFVIRVGTATRTGCAVPIPSSTIEVYPPDQSSALRIPFTTGSCSVSVQSVGTPG
ncbi:MAG: DUF4232 domain-containing protein [Dermatophilaceae bacterium]